MVLLQQTIYKVLNYKVGHICIEKSIFSIRDICKAVIKACGGSTSIEILFMRAIRLPGIHYNYLLFWV